MGRLGKDQRGRFLRGQPVNPAALRQARLDAGLTLAQLADGIVTAQAVNQYEQGRSRPKRDNLAAMAERLRVPVAALLANPRDPREAKMRDLAERRQLEDLRRLAAAVIADRTVTTRSHAIARFYLGRAILNEDQQGALAHLSTARRELARTGEPWLAAEARDWEGFALYLMERPEAIDIGRDALARYRRLATRDPGVEARILEHIGTYQLQRQEIPEAMSSYHEAIDVAGSGLDLWRLALIYHGLASSCLRIGQSRQALDYFERAVNLSRTAHDVRGAAICDLARLENDYADLLLRNGRWERAEEMLRASLDHFDAAGVEAGRTYPLLTMGDLRRQQGRIEDAMSWTHEAIELGERLGETVSVALGYQQLGELWADQGDEDRFEASFSRALEVLDEAGLTERRAEGLALYRRLRDARSVGDAGRARQGSRQS